MSIRPKIVVVGSVNADLVLPVEHLPRPNETVSGGSLETHVGGKGLNQAVASARLGAEVILIGAIGDDAYGEDALTHLRRNGVNTDFIVTRPRQSTGTAQILVQPNGENMIAVSPGANAALSRSDVARGRDVIASAHIVMAQLEVPNDAIRYAFHLARAAKAMTLLNPAPVTAEALDLFNLCDFLTPNETELASLTGNDSRNDPALHAALLLLSGRSGSQAVVTLGERGCATLIDGALVRIPTLRVDAIDATGAGDVFNGALAYQLAMGAPLIDAMRFANAASAFSVMRETADSAPLFNDVSAILHRLAGG